MTNPVTRVGEVLAPVVTPFDDEWRPAARAFVDQCRWLLERNVGLAVFGTNSEANSLALSEKRWLLEKLVEAGLPASRMMPGTGCCAYPETIELCRAALDLGITRVLMLPPFFYKHVPDDGLFEAYARIIDGVGDDRLRIYLYHIPPIAQVPISEALIERLLAHFPDTIAGAKDSSGDWGNTQMMLERFAPHGFEVFPGSESFLLRTMRAGGAGCISATANVNPAAIAALAADWQTLDARSGVGEGTAADDAQLGLDRVRAAFQRQPMIQAMKAELARFSGRGGWRRVRPPLMPLADAEIAELERELDAIGFAIEGL
ncbi:MAG: dihydrodipicolinate synthase family protein [Burkholderiaceae bacterium]